MSRSRHVWPSIRYSLSPDRYSRRVTSTSRTASRSPVDVMPVAVTVAVAWSSWPLAAVGWHVSGLVKRASTESRRPTGSADGGSGDAAEPQPDLGGAGRLSRIRAAEDDVFHLLAAQALRALFAHDPGQGVGDVALAAAVRADNRGHPAVEGQLGAIGKRLEAGYFETFETHSAAGPATG